MNLADSQRLRGILQGIGYRETEKEEEADLILFNTCCVRQHAETRLSSRVQRLKKLKEQKPHLLIAVGGCMAQKEQKTLFELLPIIDLAFGPNDIERLPQLLEGLEPGEHRSGPFAELGTFLGEQADGLVLDRSYSAFVNIVRGCTNFCTYCIVPFVRGPEVSRPLEELVAFVRELVAKEVLEVILLGQNVNVYGRDLGLPEGFSTLCEKLQEIDGLKRIRFITSHPRDFSEEAVRRLAAVSKVCEQFHLPVQAGSNRILASMNRGYTREKYLSLVSAIRWYIPEACISTDIICGFPSETEEEFEETLDLVRQARFDTAYMYFFSPRPGTKAADFPDQLPEEQRKARLARLIEVVNRIALEVSQKQIGRRFEVLVEELGDKPGMVKGKTRPGRTVDFAGDASLIGKLVEVEITEARLWTLSGRPSGSQASS